MANSPQLNAGKACESEGWTTVGPNPVEFDGIKKTGSLERPRAQGPALDRGDTREFRHNSGRAVAAAQPQSFPRKTLANTARHDIELAGNLIGQ